MASGLGAEVENLVGVRHVAAVRNAPQALKRRDRQILVRVELLGQPSLQGNLLASRSFEPLFVSHCCGSSFEPTFSHALQYPGGAPVVEERRHFLANGVEPLSPPLLAFFLEGSPGLLPFPFCLS